VVAQEVKALAAQTARQYPAYRRWHLASRRHYRRGQPWRQPDRRGIEPVAVVGEAIVGFNHQAAGRNRRLPEINRRRGVSARSFDFQTASIIRKHSFAISRPEAREFGQDRSTLSIQRAQGMPGARCTRSLVRKV
jgi:hypothetical protein